MTETSARKPRLQERRAKRIADSAARQQAHADQRFAATQTPVDLLGAAYTVLRGRLVQYERKALASLERAKGESQRAAARERLDSTRAEVERISNEAVAQMARLADQIHTERR
jgi:hypothetical protein